MQWLQDPNQRDIDNLNSVKREASRQFRKEEKEYLKPEIGEVEISSNIKSSREFYRVIDDLKKGYQPITNIVKDEKGDWFYRLPQYFGWVEELFLSAVQCTWG
jgi:hypothetical protein